MKNLLSISEMLDVQEHGDRVFVERRYGPFFGILGVAQDNRGLFRIRGIKIRRTLLVYREDAVNPDLGEAASMLKNYFGFGKLILKDFYSLRV